MIRRRSAAPFRLCLLAGLLALAAAPVLGQSLANRLGTMATKFHTARNPDGSMACGLQFAVLAEEAEEATGRYSMVNALLILQRLDEVISARLRLTVEDLALEQGNWRGTPARLERAWIRGAGGTDGRKLVIDTARDERNPAILLVHMSNEPPLRRILNDMMNDMRIDIVYGRRPGGQTFTITAEPDVIATDPAGKRKRGSDEIDAFAACRKRIYS